MLAVVADLFRADNKTDEMPTYQTTYYLDASTLGSATCVFMDSGLNIVAPDGYYSDGTLVRELISGILQPYTTCPVCGDDCRSGNKKDYNNSTTVEKGVYEIVFQTADVGAIIIKVLGLSATDKPMGIYAMLDNGVYTNRLSCNYNVANPAENLIKPSVVLAYPHPVFFGRRGDACGCGNPFGPSAPVGCNAAMTKSMLTSKMEWDPLSGQFVIQPSLVNWSYNISMTDQYLGNFYTPDDPLIPLNPVDPAGAWMVLPRIASDSNTVRIFIYTTCDLPYFQLEVSCPMQLPYVAVSARASAPPQACDNPIDRYMYFVSVSTGITSPPYPTDLGLNDWVFSDVNGKVPALNGFYRINGGSDYMEVRDGRVILIAPCM